MDQNKVTFIVEDKEISCQAEEGRTILDMAIVAEANPPYSCMEGICSQCEAKVIEGAVKVLDGFETSGHPKRVKTCQSFPQTFPLKIKY